jgi:uncharacterized protein YukE
LAWSAEPKQVFQPDTGNLNLMDCEKEKEMGLAHQEHRVYVDIAKGFREIRRAENAFYKEKLDSGVNHLAKALNDFGAAVDHAEKAADDASDKAAKDIDKGNAELQKSIDAYGDDDNDKAVKHYDRAVAHFDDALDLIV